MRYKSILLIGGSGALGQQLAKVFVDQPLTVWTRAQVDITNESALRSGIEAVKPDLIINAAAYNDVDGAETDSTLAFAINATAVGVMAATARELGADFVTYSTDYVFDGEAQDGYDESATPYPINVYGESKLQGERLAQEQGGKVWLIRVSRLFGPQGSGASAKENFPDKMLKLAQTRPRLEVINDVLSTPTYTVDVAQATRALLERETSPGIYHLINEGTGSWYDIAQETFRIKQIAVEVVPVSQTKFPVKAKRPANSTLLNTKLPKLRSWQEALKEYLES